MHQQEWNKIAEEVNFNLEIDIERFSTEVLVTNGFDHKHNLDKGRQNNPKIHRLFLTKGQYNKFVNRCFLSP
jgi:hypothetical protein